MKSLVAGALVVSIVLPALAEEPSNNELFADANRLFEDAASDEDLERAAAGYERLIKRGLRNAHLYYNLGNTRLRLNDVGRAILNFRRALLLSPEHAYARAMLDDTRAKVERQVPDLYRDSADGGIIRTLFFWHYGSSFRARLAALIAVSTAFWALLALKLFATIPLHRFLLGTLLFVAIAVGASLVASGIEEGGRAAVLVAKETEVRSGNGPGFPLALDRPVPAGVGVTVLEERGHWLLVRFPSGLTGWIRGESAGFVEPL